VPGLTQRRPAEIGQRTHPFNLSGMDKIERFREPRKREHLRGRGVIASHPTHLATRCHVPIVAAGYDIQVELLYDCGRN
jgi:hypothetical protein